MIFVNILKVNIFVLFFRDFTLFRHKKYICNKLLYASESALFFNYGFMQTFLLHCFSWGFLLFFLKDSYEKIEINPCFFFSFISVFQFFDSYFFFKKFKLRPTIFSRTVFQKYLLNVSEIVQQNPFEICWHLYVLVYATFKRCAFSFFKSFCQTSKCILNFWVISEKSEWKTKNVASLSFLTQHGSVLN